MICAVALFYRCLLTHQKVKAKPIPPNSTVKPDIPLTMVTHVPMAPGTTNPQTHNETLTSLLISFIYGSDHWSRFASFGLIHITFKGHRCLTGGPCLMPYIRSSCRVSETSTHRIWTPNWTHSPKGMAGSLPTPLQVLLRLRNAHNQSAHL